jgi:hypothetical protein
VKLGVGGSTIFGSGGLSGFQVQAAECALFFCGLTAAILRPGLLFVVASTRPAEQQEPI